MRDFPLLCPRQPRVRRLAICALWAGVAWACSEPSGAPDALPSPPADVIAAPCPFAALRPDNACCPMGHFYSWEFDECASVGPPECASQIMDAPSDCHPRWCWDHLNSVGQPCVPGQEGCDLIGRECALQEIAAGLGCLAGSYPDPDGGGCHAAGGQVRLPGGATVVSSHAAGPLPTPEPPRWCVTDQGDGSRGCGPGEVGCPVGSEPDPASAGSCRPLQGVRWVCPQGFVVDPTRPVETGMPGRCVPDPKACGDDIFGGVTGEQGLVYIDATAPDGGTGTRSKPLNSLEYASAMGSKGVTFVLAAGTYPVDLVLTTDAAILGRCAAMVTIQGVTGSATLRIHSGAVVHLQGFTLRGTGPGMDVWQGSRVTAQGLFVDGVEAIGVVASHVGTSLELRRSVVANTVQRKKDGKFGHGVYVQEGAVVKLEEVRLSHNTEAGLTTAGAGTRLEADDLMIDGTRPRPMDGHLGVGASFEVGSHAALRRLLVVGNRAAGVVVQHPGTEVSIHDAWVRDTRTHQKLGTYGSGVTVQFGAALALHRARLTANHSAALLVTGVPGGRLEANDVLVEHTLPNDSADTFGRGLEVIEGGQARLERAWLVDNREHGVVVAQHGSQATLTDTLIQGTRPAGNPDAPGRGMTVYTGGHVRLERVRVHDNVAVGVRAVGPNARIDGHDLLVDHTRARADGLTGRGLEASGGALVRLTRARLSHNVDIGISALDLGSRLELRDTMVDHTAAELATGRFGFGVMTEDKAGAVLYGTRVLDNRDLGVVISAGSATLAGAHVAATRPRAFDQKNGMALYCGNDHANTEQCTVLGSRLSANHTAAIMVQIGTLDARSLAVAGTRFAASLSVHPDETKLLADGLVIAQSAVKMRRSVSAGNLRSGMLVVVGGTAVLEHTTVAGNLYGVVTQDGGATKLLRSLFADNKLANSATDKGFSVPSAPQLGSSSGK